MSHCDARVPVEWHGLLGQEVCGAELRGAGRHWGKIPGAERRGAGGQWGRRSWGRTSWGRTSLGQYPWGSRSVGQEVLGQEVGNQSSQFFDIRSFEERW